MKYPSMEVVLALYQETMARTGGLSGLRDLALLEAALARPHSTFDGKELYPTLFLKAACLMHSLILNHAFVDGNKRIGVVLAGTMLAMNGYQLEVERREMVSFTLSVAEGKRSVEEIAAWLEAHSRAIAI
ncbi:MULTISPECIES: type II toxin-antitoxin system death-on-curing family toxin [Neomoorella]|nr:type II toxin-antitoxin system death-on-curing family toxin [Moorella sp. E308F]GEA15138.1 death-on-curing protein [Moorella sp. E308F]